MHAEDWIKLYDTDQNEIEARIIAVKGESVTIEVRKDKKVFHLPLKRLAEDSQKLVLNWSGQAESGGGKKPGRKKLEIPIDLPKRLYPRSLVELEDELDEILKLPGKSGYAENQIKALNILNAYRFLSGVPADLKLDKDKVSGATDAANACQKHGSLSHDIGSFTDKCNLHQGQATIASSISGYMDDPGPNNRNDRGHRRWCLNPPMAEVGFGESTNKGFYAMWSMDHGGKGNKGIWAYPGEGLYPLSYLHGNGWSCYLNEKAPPADELKVEVYRLLERPEKPFSSNEEIPGEALPVSFVHTYENGINFEPTGKIFTDPGIFYVRIKGGGVKEAYLVELIDL